MAGAVMNTIYNHYLTTYAPKSTSAYDTHKKSELRSVYNSILKLNRDSSLFLVDTGKETQNFAVGIKEEARNLRNTIASLGGLNEEVLLNRKTAYSANEDVVSARYIGSGEDDVVPSYELQVRSLASAQKNMGSFLPSSAATGLAPDAYSFDINIQDLNYEFQFNVNPGDTNKDLQERLSRLITNANIGLHAETMEDGSGNSSLVLISDKTGLGEGADSIFSVTDDKTSKQRGSVSYLGIQDITAPASNASFTLNGLERSTMSNSFTVEKTYELTLNGTSGEENAPVTVSLKNDVDSLTDNLSNLTDSYNGFLKTVSGFVQSQPGSKRLLNEMLGISASYREEMNPSGMEIQEDGSIRIDRRILSQSLQDNERAAALLDSAKDFASSVVRKTEQISLNPMDYTQKTLVAYKKPGGNFTAPYITSAYSGMMFNYYC